MQDRILEDYGPRSYSFSYTNALKPPSEILYEESVEQKPTCRAREKNEKC